MNVIARRSKMTVAEFQTWQPEAHPERRWQLIDGTPVCMSPPSLDHGRIISELNFLLKTHLNATMPGCDAPVGVGVVPSLNPTQNQRIPDLLVTCEPAGKDRSATSPIIMAEVLSPSNAGITRSNVAAYQTIPSVKEVLLLHSLQIKGELTRRQDDESWPLMPMIVQAEDPLELQSIGFVTPFGRIYRLTSLRHPES